METIYVDGQYLPRDRAVIPVDDLAVLRGYAVCDIMRTFDQKPYFIDDHIRRLAHSATQIGLDLPWTEDQIKEIVFTVIEKNRSDQEVNIRMIVTAGSSPDYFTPTGTPRLIVMATPLPALPAAWYENGVKVITLFQERPIPDAKITNYIPAAMAMKKAKAQGAVEVLYINSDNLALEATTSNLFAVFKGVLVTPGQGVLKGITRKAVMDLARTLMPVEEKPLPLADLLAADEVFITGTNKGVVPVVCIDETVINDGRPGPWTQKLMQSLRDHAKTFRAHPPL